METSEFSPRPRAHPWATSGGGRALTLIGLALALAAPLIVVGGIVLLGSTDLVRASLQYRAPVGRVILYLSLLGVFGLVLGGVGMAAIGWNIRSTSAVQGVLGQAESRIDTYRKEDAIRAQHLRFYGALFRNVSEAVVVADASGRILLWNPAAERMFGYSADEILQKDVALIVPTRLKSEHRRGLEHFRQTGHGRYIDAHVPLDLPALRKDGREIRVALTLSPIRTPGNNPPLALAIIRDVTARKQAEAALQESEERFRSAFQNAVVGMAIVSPDGQFLEVNDAYCRITGFSRGELLQKTFVSITYPDDAVRDAGLVRRLTQGQTSHLTWEKRYVRKDGNVVWVQVSASTVRDDSGKPAKILALVENIDARKRAEDELRKSEERFRLLVTEVKDYAIFFMDPGGHVQSWNEGAERIKGWTAEEILGEHFSKFYTPEDRAAGRPQANLEAALQQGRMEDEGWRVRKDGSRFWADVVITSLRNEEGRLVGFAKVTRDVAERSCRGPESG